MQVKKVYIYPSLGGSRSMQRYLDGVCSGLNSNGVPWEIVKPSNSSPWSKYISYPLLALKRNKENGKHLIISERYAYLSYFIKSNAYVVCHDLHSLYQEAKTPWIHKMIYRFFLKAMMGAHKVVCISEHTKKDLLRFYSKFSYHSGLLVVHNGIEEFWSGSIPAQNESANWTNIFNKKKVLLSVGIDAWYKNNTWSLKLLNSLEGNFHLLRIGEFNQGNQRLIKSLQLDQRITQVTNVSDNLLKLAYQKSTILLFPSISEGFGWPAMEAAMNGCPVASDGLGATSELFHNEDDLIKLNDAKGNLILGDLRKSMPKYSLWSDQVKMLLS